MKQRETIYGQILAKANHYQAVPDKATGGSRIILDEAYRRYAQNFKQQCKVYKDRLIDAPFILYVHVWHSSNRFDLDNSLKSLLDLLQDVRAITDDNLCIGIQAVKHIDKQRPRIEYCIYETQPRLF